MHPKLVVLAGGFLLLMLRWPTGPPPGVDARRLLQAAANASSPATTPATSAASLPPGCPPVSLTKHQTGVYNAMNAVRSIYGAVPLALDPILMCAAEGAAADATLAAQCFPVSDTLGVFNSTVRGRIVLCEAALDGCTLGPVDANETVQLTSCHAASAGQVVHNWLRLDPGWNTSGVASSIFTRTGIANNQADPTIFYTAVLSP